MSKAFPKCQQIEVFAYRGDRSSAFVVQFQTKLQNARNNRGPDLTLEECLQYAGHVGVSMDGGKSILGFNPDRGKTPVWEMVGRLARGEAFPGVVRDDSNVFAMAMKQKLQVLSFTILLPPTEFQTFKTDIQREEHRTSYRYSFPDGDGDCNCATWLERLGLPLLTGRMDEFVAIPSVLNQRSRRFGQCT